MPKVSIIGAGDVGSSVAYTIQLSGSATEIVLVDADKGRAEGHALDMNHGLFFTAPVRIMAGGYADCAGSDLVVVTAGARQKENETRNDLTRRNGAIVRGIIEALEPHLGSAKILVITNPVDVMTRLVLETSALPSRRVFGSGTVLDSARFRYVLSAHCEVDPRNVHAYVIGEHGDSEVFLWSQVRIGGIGLEWFCPECGKKCSAENRRSMEESVRRSAYHLIEAKGFTNYGVSLAARRIIEAVLRNESSVLTVSALLDGLYGMSDVCLSVPCLVNAVGVARMIEAPLTGEEREALYRSAEVIKSAGRGVAA
ncbi:MAG: L-lactate dehydrogenase [Syntrophorhabdales bacterium]